MRISDETLAKAIEFQDVPEVKLVLMDLRDARAMCEDAMNLARELIKVGTGLQGRALGHRFLDKWKSNVTK